MITRLSQVCSFSRNIFLFFAVTTILFIFAFMKSDRLEKSIKALVGNAFGIKKKNKSEFRNPPRYRLDFISENTFNRVWTLRFSRARVLIMSITFIAAIGALMFVLVFFTPVRKLLPGRLEGDLRSRYVDMAMRLDSLEQHSNANDIYITNLRNIMTGNADSTAFAAEPLSAYSRAATDSMLAPSETEREFVQFYEASDRFNLSVLTPIAAEGMAFYSPIPDALTEPETDAKTNTVNVTHPDRLPVSAAYRGTAISVYPDATGQKTVIVQHPNDFVSIYSGLSDCFITPGARVVAGERIGHSGSGNTFRFELWHNGAATDPTDYIAF